MKNLNNNQDNQVQEISIEQMALNFTTKNLVKRGNESSKKTNNDYLLELLLDAKPLTRIEIVSKIALKKMEEQMEQKLTTEWFEDEAFQINFNKMITTVKNAVDTSISKSNNNSSFHFNPKFAEYEMQETNHKYTIVKKEQ